MYFHINIERLLRNEFGIINNYYGDHHFYHFQKILEQMQTQT